MRTLRPVLRAYIAIVIAAALVALGAGAAVLRPATEDLAVSVVVLALATLAQIRPVHLSQKTKVTVEDAATLAVALLLHPALAMLIAGGSRALAGIPRRMTWYNRAFNVAAAVLDTGVAAAGFALLANGTVPALATLPAIAAAGALKFGMNTTLVDLAVSLQLRRRPFANWWSRHRREAPLLVGLYAVGAMSAIAAADSAAALALFLAPSGLALIGLRNIGRVEARTKRAVRTLGRLIEQRDHYTYGHSQRVADYAERLARRMRMDPAQIELIREAAYLHDVGKIATPDGVLRKAGALDADERSVMHDHAEHGYAIVEQLPAFSEGAEFVRSHHERVDGTGYPRGLRGSELPLEVSVIAVADSYDAMTTDRVYRKALPWEAVRAELLRERGRQWHESVVDAFLEMIDEAHRPRPAGAAA
jgi:putative nucleotidyltransferase with HDIG domain